MRNGTVDIYKFFFSWSVVFFHFYSATSEHFKGSIGVEFFMLVSGVFFFLGWEKTERNVNLAEYTPYQYLKRRYSRLLPYTLLGFIFSFLVSRIYLQLAQGNAITFNRILEWLSGDIWEILLIDMNGLNNNKAMLNSPVWTVSAMLIVEFVFISLLINCKKLFCTFICPLIVLVGLGYWRHIDAASVKLWVGFTTFGVIKVAIITCLSYYCYLAVKALQRHKYSRLGKYLLTGCEFGCLAVVVVITELYDSRYFEWVSTLFAAIAISIAIAGVSYSTNIFRSSIITKYLGQLSFGIYLVHTSIHRIWAYRYPDPYEMYSHKFLFAICVLLTAVVFCALAKQLIKYGNRFIAFIKPKLIQTDG